MTNKDVNGDNCPMGLECAMHYRNDERILLEDAQQGRLVSYRGGYCIITDVTEDLLSYMFGERYVTDVIKVGEGTISDLWELPQDEQSECVVFTQRHNDWSAFEDAHQMVIEGVKNGTLGM
jgi:hypothetical protein